MSTIITITATGEAELVRNALTLATLTVTQRLEKLRQSLRGRTGDERAGLERQILEELAALDWLEARRGDAYRIATAPSPGRALADRLSIRHNRGDAVRATNNRIAGVAIGTTGRVMRRQDHDTVRVHFYQDSTSMFTSAADRDLTPITTDEIPPAWRGHALNTLELLDTEARRQEVNTRWA